MKRTTAPRTIKLTEGRKALIQNATMYNKYLKGKADNWSNEYLLHFTHPLDREQLSRNL